MCSIATALQQILKTKHWDNSLYSWGNLRIWLAIRHLRYEWPHIILYFTISRASETLCDLSNPFGITNTPPTETHLLASLISAMAIRILFLRKMSSRMMMTSRIARMITDKRSKRNRFVYIWYRETLQDERECALTEGQPGLSDLQVDREVQLEAQVTDGDVRPWPALQTVIFHVTVENT